MQARHPEQVSVEPRTHRRRSEEKTASPRELHGARCVDRRTVAAQSSGSGANSHPTEKAVRAVACCHALAGQQTRESMVTTC